MYKGSKLDNDKTLIDYQITEGDELVLTSTKNEVDSSYRLDSTLHKRALVNTRLWNKKSGDILIFLNPQIVHQDTTEPVCIEPSSTSAIAKDPLPSLW